MRQLPRRSSRSQPVQCGTLGHLASAWRTMSSMVEEWSEVVENALRQPVDPTRKRTSHEADMTTVLRLVQLNRGRYFVPPRQHSTRQKRIVTRVEHEGGHGDIWQQRPRSRPGPIVVGIAKAMQRRSDDIVEFVQVAAREHRGRVEQP